MAGNVCEEISAAQKTSEVHLRGQLTQEAALVSFSREDPSSRLQKPQGGKSLVGASSALVS
jgi:hypothetical protein